MEELENSVLKKARGMVRLWRRYVDDTLAVVKEGTEDIILQVLNNEHGSIRFTCEKEVEGRIPFLDVDLKREDGEIRRKVFRKSTATQRDLDFSSAHCNSVKWGVVSCMRRRAERICSQQEDLDEEIDNLRKVFVRNGYPKSEVRRRLEEARKRPRKKGEETGVVIRIPFVPSLSKVGHSNNVYSGEKSGGDDWRSEVGQDGQLGEGRSGVQSGLCGLRKSLYRRDGEKSV